MRTHSAEGYIEVEPARREAGAEKVSVVVNGSQAALAEGTTVEVLVTSWCESPKGIAVARNREVVPRSEWGHTVLESGDRLEIVSAAAGG